MTISDEKKELRRKVLNERRRLFSDVVEEDSAVICDKLLKETDSLKCSKICLYMPINNEVDVRLIFDRLLSLGKEIYIPKVCGKDIIFYLYEGKESLAVGSFGIMEPVSGKELEADDDTFVVLPGAVFSRERDRVGYGGGFYDRFMKKHPGIKNAAVCYDMQIYVKIPADSRDVKPDMIITEKEIIR